jgi:peptide chain release factor 2
LKLEEQISDPDFWSQPEKSQKAMRDRKRIEEALAHDQKIGSLTSDLDTLFELAREGERMETEIAQELKPYSELLEKLETEMLLSGENDAKSAIVTMHPGAGGTESQDWAEMLLRMYLRWAERNQMGVVITDRQEGLAA